MAKLIQKLTTRLNYRYALLVLHLFVASMAALFHVQHVLGGLSGVMGPMSNAPIDTTKTRIQRTPNPSSERGFTRFMHVTKDLIKNEGARAFYKGLMPRVMRVAPGQAVTFMVYEKSRI